MSTDDDPLAVLFAIEDRESSFEMDRWCLPHGYMADLAARLRELVDELTGFSRYGDTRVYVTAIHALALELAALTGAPVNGRSHPAFRAFLEERAARWEALSDDH